MSQEKLLITHKPLATQNNCVSAESYQNLIRSGGQNRKSVGISALFSFFGLFPLASLKHDINNFAYEIFHGLFLFFSLSKNQRLSDFVLPKCCHLLVTLRHELPGQWKPPQSCLSLCCEPSPQLPPACAALEKCGH